MAAKRKNLFLYLTLACFLGIIAIFTVDGYMGIYDTVYIAAGEQEQAIEPDHWLRQDTGWIPGPPGGDKVFFLYEVDNRWFSNYSANISVSIWHSQEKVRDVVSQQMSIAAFNKGSMEWAVDTADLRPEGLPPERPYEYSVIISRGDVTRKVVGSIIGTSFPIKPPVPVR